ncbi:MAG: cytochrome ubiquinol oxidase subunit I [Nitrospirae bacterium]|nr:cytochrome ubiquinol oxidase subunit I [Candidatus Manganitrophaceae bacterium]
MSDILEKLGPVHLPLLGNSVAVGIFSLLHIALASLAVAFVVIAPVFESMERENRFHADVALGLTRFTLITFTVSTVLAVIMLELFVGLFPLTNSWVFNRFRHPIYFGVAAFFLLLFTLYPYYHYWEPIRRRSRSLHLTLGFLAAFFALIWVAILDGIGSYMLTPGGRGLFNPTWIPLMIHRFFGNFVFGGFAIAAYAAWMLGRKKGTPDEPYYLHLLKTGFLIGLGALLIQPFTGLFYATQIHQADPAAYQQTIQGRYQGWVYLQFALIALLFVGSHFLLRTSRSTRKGTFLSEGIVLLIALLMVVFVELPMVRRLFTFALVALTFFYLYSGWRGWRAAGGEQLNRTGVRRLTMTLGIVALFTYWTMGTIRETARRPDTVRGMISLQDESQTPKFFTRGETPASTGTPPQKGGTSENPEPRG